MRAALRCAMLRCPMLCPPASGTASLLSRQGGGRCRAMLPAAALLHGAGTRACKLGNSWARRCPACPAALPAAVLSFAGHRAHLADPVPPPCAPAPFRRPAGALEGAHPPPGAYPARPSHRVGGVGPDHWLFREQAEEGARRLHLSLGCGLRLEACCLSPRLWLEA